MRCARPDLLRRTSRHRCRRCGLGRRGDVPLWLILGGGARQRAARHSRSWAVLNSSRQGQLVASATFTRRTETVTCAPIFRRRSRMVAQVARSRSVPASAIRRHAGGVLPARRAHQDVGKRREPHAQLVGAHRRRRHAVAEQIGLRLLDPVLHLAALAVDVLVEGPRVDHVSVQRGGPGLDPG